MNSKTLSRKDFLLGAGTLLGSGAFASPVRSLVGAQGIGMVESEGAVIPSASNYIQDGLIAMWDGVENAGWGVHDPNARVWKDLSPFQNDLVIDGTTLSFHNDFLLWTPRTDVSQTIPFEFEVWKNATCGIVMQSTTTADAFLLLGSSGCALGCKDKRGLLTRGTNGGYCQYYAFARENDFSTYTQKTLSAYTGDTKPYINAEKVASSLHVHTNRSPDYYSITMFSGKASSGEIRIKSFRYYSRALTEEEIEYNHEIDRIRFNLP